MYWYIQAMQDGYSSRVHYQYCIKVKIFIAPNKYYAEYYFFSYIFQNRINIEKQLRMWVVQYNEMIRGTIK